MKKFIVFNLKLWFIISFVIGIFCFLTRTDFYDYLKIISTTTLVHSFEFLFWGWAFGFFLQKTKAKKENK